MKKVFAFVAMMGLLTFGVNQTINAQETEEAAAVEEVAQQDSAAVDSIAAADVEDAQEDAEISEEKKQKEGLHKTIKVKFIEGSAGFMSLVAIAMIFGLALCIERIIFLSLSEINSKKLLEDIQAALENGDVEGAKSICRETRGPVASICYQGMLRIDEGLDVVERSVVSYGSVQASNLEKNLSWITLFIAMSPSLGFLGTVIGMVQAFNDIQRAGDISPQVVAGGMKVALITTIFGIIVALILQVFYNYILSKVEALNTDMEDSSVSLLDIIMKYNLKFKK
ncbi:MAG: MotA/TolQ/ExbB proton channel family protein [Bacteroidaceae bacterium]|nr:MotA/TolQ/ExbB proton channel family protein [Bacteroidaceae bacterium]